jgi:endonuclease-8
VPEGDTIFRTAASLRTWLGDRELTGARSTSPSVPAHVLVGDRVADVEARGKHLLIRFASGRVLHTHMRMTGSWHVYRAGERWKRPAGGARVVLEAGDRVAVCFDAPVVELLAARMEAVHPALQELGPDILREPFDPTEVVRRARTRLPGTPVGEILLDQRVVAGIGNVYRSECLFLAGLAPDTPLSVVPGDRLLLAVGEAARLMRANAGPAAGARRDVGLGPGRHWVYGRQGRPCRRCGAAVRVARIGRQARTAYWCPSCQPPVS